MHDTPPRPPDSTLPRNGYPTIPLPWRSADLGWLTAAAALVVGVPLFLRMPPWCDLTLYDVAARNVSWVGVHYRDVFDTNPPGFVWALVGIRTLFGNSVEAVRAVDLAVVAATVALLGGWVRRAGGSPAGVAWMAAGACAFYPFVGEYSHCQRDVWMTLPVVGAARLRLRRADTDRRPVLGAVVEGFVVGAAAWLKPHALLPAAAVWLATLPRVAGGSWRRAGIDFAGNLVGGLIALGLGVGWLVGTGAWPAFVEVFTFWNPGYLDLVFREFPSRWPYQFSYFPPWSWFQPFALVLAVVAVTRGRRNPDRAALAALFLVWVGQGLFLQRMFEYAHVPETLLMLALFASFGVPAGFVGLAVIVLGFAPHPAADPHRMACWPACWRADLSPAEYRDRRNAVGFQVDRFNGIDWVQLGEASDFLAAQRLRDGELIAWHDTPHALYLTLGVRPGFRFMHVSTVTQIGEVQYERVRDELHAAAPKARFVVADLERVFDTAAPGERETMEQPGAGANDLLPPAFAERFPRLAAEFPFDQTPVFRSAGGRGRYVVFRLDRPVTPECRIPPGLGIDLPPD